MFFKPQEAGGSTQSAALHEIQANLPLVGGICPWLDVNNMVRYIPEGKRAHAYYIDELGENCLVDGNAAINCEWPLHIHMTTRNIFRCNLFITGGASALSFPEALDFRKVGPGGRSR